MLISVIIVSLIGVGVSLYGIMVERKVSNGAQYKAACDISDKVSCSKLFLSPYAKMLGFSNVWAALLYFCLIIVLAMMDLAQIVFLLTVLGVIASVGFAYILFFKIRTLCLICISLYCINIALMIAAYFS